MAVNDDLTEAQVEEFFSTLSNWGKWGANDQLGALTMLHLRNARRQQPKYKTDTRCRCLCRWRRITGRIIRPRSCT